ncbi:DUF6777 domain-containing protein [Streptomyces sp. XY511]|uniref:DUF6777 domain-containing protein n=1 Tax=Streptomyces sp. XY511 TaxID=1519480 RepID=UPI0006AE174A|nr:DUF6777 domain-containing protein [Streptomyces sp. XY511]
MSASTAAVVVSAAVVSFTVLGGNSAAGGEVFLEAAAAAGPDPFTPSTATEPEEAVAAPETTGTVRGSGGTSGARTLEVDGGHPGLYGGTRNVASCDVEKQIKFLTAHPDKGGAFAATVGVRQAGIPSYLRSLTPVRLGWDTRVTNHGYRNSAPTGYQAILQAGTSVLVDGHGVPRVRCACGNPLTPPVAVQGKARLSGTEWSSFRSAELVAVRPAAKPVKAVTVFDPGRKAWYERPSGAARGRTDREVEPPPSRPGGSPYPALPPAHEGSVRTSPADADTKPATSPDEAPDPAPGVAPGRNLDPARESVDERHGDTGRAPQEDAPKHPDKAPEDSPHERHPHHDKDSVKEPGRHQGKEPGGEPGKGRGTDPGEAPAKVPDKDREKESGQDTGKQPGKAPGQESGKEPANPPGTDPAKVPGGDRDKESGGESAGDGPREGAGRGPG